MRFWYISPHKECFVVCGSEFIQLYIQHAFQPFNWKGKRVSTVHCPGCAIVKPRRAIDISGLFWKSKLIQGSDLGLVSASLLIVLTQCNFCVINHMSGIQAGSNVPGLVARGGAEKPVDSFMRRLIKLGARQREAAGQATTLRGRRLPALFRKLELLPSFQVTSSSTRTSLLIR